MPFCSTPPFCPANIGKNHKTLTKKKKNVTNDMKIFLFLIIRWLLQHITTDISRSDPRS